MTTTEKQRLQQAELHKNLWKMANELRGQMAPNDFKNYILGLIFYRYLSEKTEDTVNAQLGEGEGTYAEFWEQAGDEEKEILRDYLIRENGYIIEPQHLFSHMVKEIEKKEEGNFDIEILRDATRHVTESTIGENSEDDFSHLFDDMDLNSVNLGRTVSERSTLIAKIILSVNRIPFVFGDTEIDVLGDAYEYLISQFAANAGKKAGEFYTPQQVSKILAKVVAHGRTDIKSVYDPTCGSGSLLLRVAREANVRSYYGQELTTTTYNLARMNMLLHDVNFENFNIQNGNTLTDPLHGDQKFSAIVANPPYSAHWPATPDYLKDDRFSDYGKLAPKTKADFAFVQHMIHHLDDDGTMAVVLPHGVLFRGQAEAVIRKHLIEPMNVLDAVIGLPENIFFGTSIPTVILVFKKCRKTDDVLFIDASKEFEKGKNQNYLTDEHVERIVEAYAKRDEIERFSHKATRDEIRANDYNLNIPRYVDTFIEEDPIDIDEVNAAIREKKAAMAEHDTKIAAYFKELGIEV